MSQPASPPRWDYDPAADLERSVAERLQGFPREPHMWVFALRALTALGVRAWLRVYHRFTVVGREHLPQEGSCVLVANHSSHLDAVSLMAALPLARLHRTFPAAAADYFFCNLPRSFFAAVCMNALPFDRQVNGAESLAVCRRLLDGDGNALVLFPEGTRCADGRLGRFRSGIGRLVVGSPTPVVPCYLEGAFAAWPKGRALPRPGRLTLRVGPPRSFEGLANTPEAVQSICAQLRADVAALGGEEFA